MNKAVESNFSRRAALKWQIPVVLTSFALYGIVFPWVYDALGMAAGALVVLPIILASWLFGLRGGLMTTAIASLVYNPLLYAVFTDHTASSVGDLWTRALPAIIADFVIALTVGYTRNLSRRLRHELRERQRTEAALRESELRIRAMLDSALDASITIDEAGEVVEFNAAAERMFGYTRQDIVGRPMADLMVPPHLRAAHADGMRRLLSGGETRMIGRRVETTAMRSDGTVFPVELAISQIEEDGIHLFSAFLRDITERQHAERALRDSETRAKRLAMVASRSTNGIVITDNECRIEWVNDGFTRLSGYTLEDASGRYPWEVLNGPETDPGTTAFIREKLGKREAFDTEILSYRKDGCTYWVHLEVHPLCHDDGSPAGFMSIETDVSERRRMERELRHSEAFLNSIIEHIPLPVFVKEAETLRFVRLNKAALDLYGASHEEMIGKNDYDFFPPELADYYVATDRDAFDVGAITELPEQSFQTRANGERIMHARKIPLYDESGRPTYMLGIAEDVTERRLQEQTVRESETRYRLITENIKDVVMRHAADGSCRYVSPSCRDTCGYEPEELLGMGFFNSVHPDDLNQLVATMQATHQGRVAQATFRIRSKLGGYLWVETTARPLMDEEGRRQEIFTVTRDVTERKRYEQDLITAKEKAEEMSRLKSSFLANMSHEIRTPLTAIIGFSEVLAEDFDAEGNYMVEMIRSSSERLLETLNSVLDLAQLESGSLLPTVTVVDATKIASSTVDIFRRQAREKDLPLTFDAPDEPVLVETDSGAFSRILNNLVSNAIKFTDSGSVAVTMKTDGANVSIGVADTGVGISRDFLPHLFQEFRQESSGVCRSYEGNGLGLAITKRLADMLGAEIDVVSEKGKGTTFTLRVKRYHNSDSAESRASGDGGATRPVPRPRVLVVEDTPETQKLLAAFLKQDYETVITSGVEEALEKALSESFDALLIDVNLGAGRSGVDLLKSLDAVHACKGIPKIACTAYALPGDRDHLLAEGFDGYLSKPFLKKQVLQTLGDLIPGPEPGFRDATHAESANLS